MLKDGKLGKSFTKDPCSIPVKKWSELFTLLPEERNRIIRWSLHRSQCLRLI